MLFDDVGDLKCHVSKPDGFLWYVAHRAVLQDDFRGPYQECVLCVPFKPEGVRVE